MPCWEAIIAYDAAINAETDSLEVMAPTKLTTRPPSYGKAMITHAMALVSTDDVNKVRVVPSGYDDSDGFEIPYVLKYSATLGFDLAKSRLPAPVPVPNDTDIAIYATSETAANSVVVGWLLVEYAGQGSFIPIGNGPQVVREINAGGALTSVVEKIGTEISSLLTTKPYQVCAINGVGVEGQTAGIVGPAFVRFLGPSEFLGLNCFVPLPNNPPYCANGAAHADLKAAGIKMPVFKGTRLTPVFLGYTAEQPEGRVILMTDKTFAAL